MLSIYTIICTPICYDRTYIYVYNNNNNIYIHMYCYCMYIWIIVDDVLDIDDTLV